ncbi:NUDIX hydrolase [Brevibacillus sp. NRS-1366]|uniref:NUDIX hydrolase n=1 Tax=Brevibacillus sp. NRS-1366 TaxID=3233899 RepID=UPI003D2147FB
MFRYTVCFLKQNNRFLLLNRSKPPVMGLWNGVGGKLAPGEAPLDCVLREIREETGITLRTVDYKGIVSWSTDADKPGGMYAFVAELPEELDYPTPCLVDEGILAWKDLDWILHPDNEGVPQNVPLFLPTMLGNSDLFHHHFHYENGLVTSYDVSPCAEQLMLL